MFGHNEDQVQKGLAALIAVVVISFVALTVALSISFLGIGEMQMTFWQTESMESFYVASACLDEALLRLKRNPSYTGGSLNIDGNSCTITIATAGSERTIETQGTVNNNIRKIEAKINLAGGYLTLDYWKELSN